MVAPPPIVPAKITVLPEHVVAGMPAFAVAAVFIVIVFVDVMAAQTPFPLAVNVRFLLPANISPALGVYVAKVSEVALAKVPVPSVDVQIVPLVLVALDPSVILTAPDVEQVVIFVPATAVGANFIVITFVDVTDAQVPFPMAVNMRFLVPANKSPTLGV